MDQRENVWRNIEEISTREQLDISILDPSLLTVFEENYSNP